MPFIGNPKPKYTAGAWQGNVAHSGALYRQAMRAVAFSGGRHTVLPQGYEKLPGQSCHSSYDRATHCPKGFICYGKPLE
jgi:hypothetical protein